MKRRDFLKLVATATPAVIIGCCPPKERVEIPSLNLPPDLSAPRIVSLDIKYDYQCSHTWVQTVWKDWYDKNAEWLLDTGKYWARLDEGRNFDVCLTLSSNKRKYPTSLHACDRLQTVKNLLPELPNQLEVTEVHFKKYTEMYTFTDGFGFNATKYELPGMCTYSIYISGYLSVDNKVTTRELTELMNNYLGSAPRLVSVSWTEKRNNI